MQKEIEWGIHSFFIFFISTTFCTIILFTEKQIQLQTNTTEQSSIQIHAQTCILHYTCTYYLFQPKKCHQLGPSGFDAVESYTSWLPWVLRNKKEKRHKLKKYQRTLYCCFTYYSTIN